MPARKIMPTTYLLLALTVMAGLHFLFPVMRLISPLWNLLGLVPLVGGVILNLMADKAFHDAGTAVRPFEESSALITKGVFRLSRNPMYLGFALILIGTAVLMGSLTPWLIVLPFGILMERIYIAVEERMLAAKFGTGWEEYREGTRRWI
ncbi:MAG: isoprenylcysteine carboxylmethyltransferase family protein [Candidatus Aminicenantes bacterium]|nr:isoprenylcysteine carboxylmethyltransferase family protein [Candidatus Aminicenantes bacterium]